MSEDLRPPRRGASTPGPSPTGGEGGGRGDKNVKHQPRDPSWERWSVPSEQKRRMRDAARELRKNMTPTERILWEAVRANRLDGRKFRRQQNVGRFIVDFYCASERLVLEVDGDVHAIQKDADERRQEALEALGLRFVRLPAGQISTDLPTALDTIRSAFGRIPSDSGRPGKSETIDPTRPDDEALTEWRWNDPASWWMDRMNEQRRREAEARSAAAESGSPLPHPSPPVGEGPGVGAPPAADGTEIDPALSEFARTDPATRWMREQMARLEVAR